jgi:hypothetical protein
MDVQGESVDTPQRQKESEGPRRRRLLCLRKERTTVNGIGRWSSGQRSHVGSRGTLKKTLYEIFGGKIMK